MIWNIYQIQNKIIVSEKNKKRIIKKTGIGIKILDGNNRARSAAAVAVLKKMELI